MTQWIRHCTSPIIASLMEAASVQPWPVLESVPPVPPTRAPDPGPLHKDKEMEKLETQSSFGPPWGLEVIFFQFSMSQLNTFFKNQGKSFSFLLVGHLPRPSPHRCSFFSTPSPPPPPQISYSSACCFSGCCVTFGRREGGCVHSFFFSPFFLSDSPRLPFSHRFGRFPNPASRARTFEHSAEPTPHPHPPPPVPPRRLNPAEIPGVRETTGGGICERQRAVNRAPVVNKAGFLQGRPRAASRSRFCFEPGGDCKNACWEICLLAAKASQPMAFHNAEALGPTLRSSLKLNGNTFLWASREAV